MDDFKRDYGSVFRGFSIVECAAFLLLKKWDLLADHYVDFRPEPERISRQALMDLLKVCVCVCTLYRCPVQHQPLELRSNPI